MRWLWAAPLCVAGPALAQLVADVVVQPRVVVSGAREKELLTDTPMSIGVIDGTTVAQDRPMHPSQIMGQVPGVAVAVTNGEGHTTAIRQPFTTNPVYLFLEDGIPIRSTGFFNHNALYEIDIPMAGGIEVIRGPGSALYGSDAIGGIVNVLTRIPPSRPELTIAPDFGSFGWRRLLAGGGMGFGNDAWRADVNFTHTDGWRDTTAYDRQSAMGRWDHQGALGTWKTVIAYTHVDQQTGANSPLILDDYLNHPTLNYLPIAFRKVDAFRASTAWEYERGDTLLSLTPYARDNRMDLLASFNLAFDPTDAVTSNRSYGVMAKWRRDFPQAWRARLIAGVDVDVSPGGREEDRLNVNPKGSGASRVFDTYTTGPRVYDYDVTFRGVSPYVHGEASPLEKLRVTAGVRFDHLAYDFDNHQAGPPIAVPGSFPGLRFYGQASDTTRTFTHTSPKLGATYAFADELNMYVSHNYGFRVPSEGQIFRPSAATSPAAADALTQSALALKPIQAVQSEIGARGIVAGIFTYDAVLYRLVKRDDILTFRDNATNFTQVVNAGRTSHEGVEVGAGVRLGPAWSLEVAYSHARHRYEDWVTSGGDFTGKEIENAPRTLANSRLTWAPTSRTRVTLEWVRIGAYWMDAANTTRYPGHDLVNTRANVALTKGLSLFASITNLADKRYADSASISSNTPVYSPGLPRAYNVGLEARW